ncbi:MAG: hypothetical protein OEV05_14815, partial [Gammaproteobacteria bacterium]|nr:hypothetical protein [Gammaproteobacteria bacterium]
KEPTKKDPLIVSDCPGFDNSDSDGWWQVIHKHKGKPTFYEMIVTLPDPSYCPKAGSGWAGSDGVFTKFEELKGNEFSEVNIELEVCQPAQP